MEDFRFGCRNCGTESVEICRYCKQIKQNFSKIKNKRFGKLQILKLTKPYISKQGKRTKQVLCQCDCGNKRTVRVSYLKSGKTKSCGCISNNSIFLKDVVSKDFILIDETVEIIVASVTIQELQDLGYVVKKDDRIEIPTKHLTTGSNTPITVQCPYCNEIYRTIPNTVTKKNHTYHDFCYRRKQKMGKVINGLRIIDKGKVKDFLCECVNCEKKIEINYSKLRRKNHCGCRIKITTLKDVINNEILLVDKKVKTKVAGMSRFYYQNLGYKLPKDTDKEIEIDIFHLPAQSHNFINVKCPKCHKIRKARADRISACGNTTCYICTVMEQLPNIDIDNYEWRTQVYKKTNFRCAICKNKDIKLHAHHIANKSKHPQRKYDISNGIPLCAICHHDFHINHLGSYSITCDLQDFTNWLKTKGYDTKTLEKLYDKLRIEGN